MDSPVADADLTALFHHGRYRELKKQLDSDTEEISANLRRDLLGRLAGSGLGPLIDALLAARAADASLAVRRSLTRVLEKEGLEALIGDWRVDDEDDQADLNQERSQQAARSAQARANGDFAEAARLSDEATARWPQADLVVDGRVDSATDAWLAGQADALTRLRQVRDDDAATPANRLTARQILDHIELQPPGERSPRWVRSAAQFPPDDSGSILAVLGMLLDTSLPESPTPTCSHLRAMLETAGVSTLRVVLTEELAIKLLGRTGITVVLEEEQPTGAGFLVVLGLERVSGTLLIVDPRKPGALVRPIAQQWARSAQSACGALVVTGVGEAGVFTRDALAAIGIVNDQSLALVDRAHFDPHDADVPHAYVAQLARQAIATAPTIPMAHRRLGEALLALGRLGRLDEGMAVERWVSTTRRLFPDAEWPLQLYAQALELWHRYPEAMVAWHDAADIDPDDYRNQLGQVRALRQVGGLSGARTRLRQAATLELRAPQVWDWLAEEELAQGNLDAAAAAADLALGLDSNSLTAQLVLATLAEKRGDNDAAVEVLTATCEGDTPERGQTLRLWRHKLWRGDSTAMLSLAEERLLRRFPSKDLSWATMLDTHLVRGDADAALRTLFDSLDRVALDGELLNKGSLVLRAFVPPEELGNTVAALERRLAGVPGPVASLGRQLAYDAGRYDVAIPLLTRLAERHAQDGNIVLALANTMVAAGGDEEEIEALWRRIVEMAPNFAWARYVVAHRILPTRPDEAASIIEPVIDASPALFWELLARSFDAQGRTDKAAELRTRLPEVAGSVVEHAAFLRRNGALPALDTLLDAAGEGMAPSHRYRLHLERANLRRSQGRPVEAAGILRALWNTTPSAWLGHQLLVLAAMASDSETIATLGDAVVALQTNDSTADGDPWAAQAIVAASAASDGDPKPRERLLQTIPRHVLALRALVVAGRAIKSPYADDDLATLAEVAPGLAFTIDHSEF